MGAISKIIGSGNHGKGLGGQKYAPLWTTPNLPCKDRGQLMYSDSKGSDREENGPRRKQTEEYAKRVVCGGCPLRELCLEYALETREPWGIWGGTTPQERGVPSSGKAGR